MTFETYLKNRKIFESRYIPSKYFRQCYINEMNKGIRNFELFFSLYGHDRRIIISNNTYGCDRRKRYTIPFKNMVGTKLVITDFNYSMFEKFEGTFERLIEQLTKNPK